jgi:hypothetical protein
MDGPKISPVKHDFRRSIESSRNAARDTCSLLRSVVCVVWQGRWQREHTL